MGIRKNGYGTLLSFVSLAILAVVLLITQVQYFNALNHVGVTGPRKAKAATGVAFVVLGAVALFVSFYYFVIVENKRNGFIALWVAASLLLISFAAPITDQSTLHSDYKNWSSSAKTKGMSFAANVNVPNVIFFVMGNIGAITGVSIYFAVDK